MSLEQLANEQLIGSDCSHCQAWEAAVLIVFSGTCCLDALSTQKESATMKEGLPKLSLVDLDVRIKDWTSQKGDAPQVEFWIRSMDF